jgi:phage tail-like protein
VTVADLPDLAGQSGGLTVGRGLVEGLTTPAPLAPTLPALFQEDDFVQRMMAAFDEVLAPIFSTLDNFDSYLDPAMAPEDFVDWLASWVGVDIDETWTLERRRQLVRDAALLYRIRGTSSGLAAHLLLYANVTPDIEESGGCSWSQTADTPLPGSAIPSLTIHLQVSDGDGINPTTVRRIVESSRPAHLPFSVEVRAEAGELAPGDEAHAVDLSSADHGTPVALDHEPGEGHSGPVGLPGAEHVTLDAPAPEVGEDHADLDRAPEDAAGVEPKPEPPDAAEAPASPEAPTGAGAEADGPAASGEDEAARPEEPDPGPDEGSTP